MPGIIEEPVNAATVAMNLLRDGWPISLSSWWSDGHGNQLLSDAYLTGELSWLLHDAQVRLHCFPSLRILFLRLGIGHRSRDDHILPLFPVYGSRHLVLRG